MLQITSNANGKSVIQAHLLKINATEKVKEAIKSIKTNNKDAYKDIQPKWQEDSEENLNNMHNMFQRDQIRN